MLGQLGAHRGSNHSPTPPWPLQSWNWCRTPSSLTPMIRVPGSITAGFWDEVSSQGGGRVFRAWKECKRS